MADAAGPGEVGHGGVRGHKLETLFVALFGDTRPNEVVGLLAGPGEDDADTLVLGGRCPQAGQSMPARVEDNRNALVGPGGIALQALDEFLLVVRVAEGEVAHLSDEIVAIDEDRHIAYSRRATQQGA